MEVGASRMNTLSFICLKVVRWTGWLLLPVVLTFLLTGYAMSGRYGLSVLADEKTALTLHKLMHLPLGLLVIIHVIPSVYLAFLRWGWIKRRPTL
jgi:Ni,Fe-hydrogenase I cytochrome b subunit